MTNTNKEATLEQVQCISYPVQFCQKNNKDKNKDVRAMIDSSNKVNEMHSVYITKLGFRARKIDFGIQKIDGCYLDTFEIVIADCLVKDKLEKV